MRRSQIYFLSFVVTAILTPTIFFWELPSLLENIQKDTCKFALHIIPEVACLFFFGAWITAKALLCSDAHPDVKTKLKQVFLLTCLVFGLYVLAVSSLLTGKLRVYYFHGFLWGIPVLLGYLVGVKPSDR